MSAPKSEGSSSFTQEYEAALVRAWQQDRDERALLTLVTQFTPFMTFYAKRAHRRHPLIPLEDLQQGCAERFVRSLDKFEPERGLRLSTYMQWWLRASLIQQTTLDQTVRPRGKFYQSPIRIALLKERERHPEWHEPISEIFQTVADKMNVSPTVVENVFLKSFTIHSLDQPLNTNDGQASLSDFLEDETVVDPDTEIDRKGLSSSLEYAMSFLTPRQAEILRRRFGIGNDGEEEIQSDIAKSMNITRQRVQYIEFEALEKLRKILKRQALAGNTVFQEHHL